MVREGVTKKNEGETPFQSGRLLSSLFTPVFTTCCLPGSDSRSRRVVVGEGRGREVPFGRQAPSGTFCCARCEKCLTGWKRVWGGLEELEMTEAKNPCGQLSAANGVWYVAAGRLCFGSAAEDLLESPPFYSSDSVLPLFFFFSSPVFQNGNGRNERFEL